MFNKSNILEFRINRINREFFLHEFSFGRTEFTPQQETEREFCDNFIWLEECAILIQAKERDPIARSDQSSLSRWFNDKVVKYATKQVRDTLDYLSKYPSIKIENEKGHLFNINQGSLKSLHKLVIYDCCYELPNNCKNIKSHRSRTAGLIHIIKIIDYFGICKILQTPAEIIEYLNFRENYLEAILDAGEQTEKSIIGRFILSDRVPNMEYDIESKDFSHVVEDLEDDRISWDIKYLMNQISNNRYFEGFNTPSDYYNILLELLWLNRSELRELRIRLDRSVNSVQNNQISYPYRMINIKRSCGFVIIPIMKDLFKQRFTGLKNLTDAHKYENKLEKCLGVSISKIKDMFYIDYAFISSPWIKNLEIEEMLKENHPFRSLKPKYQYRYHVKPSNRE